MTKMKEMLIFRYTYEQKSHATAFFIRHMTKNKPQACCGMRWSSRLWSKTLLFGLKVKLFAYWTLDARVNGVKHKTPEIGLATKRFRAIDLSCRACGAGAWALGLDSRWGSSASLRFSPPTSDIRYCIHHYIRHYIRYRIRHATL